MVQTRSKKRKLQEQPSEVFKIPNKKTKVLSYTLFNDLPAEIVVKVFDDLTLHDLVSKFSNCSRTCVRWTWREIVAQFILRPKYVPEAGQCQFQLQERY